MRIGMETVVRLSRDQSSAEVSDEVVVVNLATGRYYGLDPVGARVWELLRTARRAAEIRDALIADYEVEAATCGRDVAQLLERLADAGLVEVQA